MQLNERLSKGLDHARGFTTQLLDEWQQPEQWVTQVDGSDQHALWIAGHLAVSDNYFTSLIAPEESTVTDEFSTLFGMGSEPVAALEKYPSVDAVRSYMTERRSALLAVLEKLDDAALAQPAPEGAPTFIFDKGALFQTVAWHEALHSGQLTLIHRKLGFKPVIGRPAPAGSAS